MRERRAAAGAPTAPRTRGRRGESRGLLRGGGGDRAITGRHRLDLTSDRARFLADFAGTLTGDRASSELHEISLVENRGESLHGKVGTRSEKADELGAGQRRCCTWQAKREIVAKHLD